MKLVVLAFVLASTWAFAQDSLDRKEKVHYFLSVNSGMLAGEKGKSITYSASVVQGVQWGRRLRVGAGFGFDTYQDWQTVPLFGQVSLDVLGKKNVVFLQLDYGWSHAWTQREFYGVPITVHGGTMVRPMIGCRIPAGNMRLYVGAGYSFQSVGTQYDYRGDQPVPYYNGFSQQTEVSLDRLILTIGAGWK